MANIYIVEDDTNIQEIEAIALKNSGHSVEQFDDAAHFYKKVRKKNCQTLRFLTSCFQMKMVMKL